MGSAARRDHVDDPVVEATPMHDAPHGRFVIMHVRAPARARGLDGEQNIHHSRTMDISRAVIVMSALAQPTRLRTWRMLVEAGEDGLASTAIAAAVGAPQNTMSAHLTILTHAGLVTRDKKGRTVTYRAVRDDVRALTTFLDA